MTDMVIHGVSTFPWYEKLLVACAVATIVHCAVVFIVELSRFLRRRIAGTQIPNRKHSVLFKVSFFMLGVTIASGAICVFGFMYDAYSALSLLESATGNVHEIRALLINGLLRRIGESVLSSAVMAVLLCCVITWLCISRRAYDYNCGT